MLNRPQKSALTRESEPTDRPLASTLRRVGAAEPVTVFLMLAVYSPVVKLSNFRRGHLGVEFGEVPEFRGFTTHDSR